MKEAILENILIEKLVFGGKGFAKLPDGKVVFITGGAVPQSIVNLRILKKRKDFIEAQITQVVKKSPLETQNYPEMTGAPWINIGYEDQLKIKETQVKESLFHIQKYQKNIAFLPILPSPNIFGYRNKIEFSFGKYISAKEGREEHFNIGFHKRGEFSRVEDYESCILIDEELNQIYKDIREFTKSSGLPAFDQKRASGFYRHLVMRKAHYTGEIMLILSFHPGYFTEDMDKKGELEKIQNFFHTIAQKNKNICSIYFSHNANLADTSIGELECIYGKTTITEKILGLSFEISPKSFFQTNSLGAETLYTAAKNTIKTSEKIETLMDLYAGTGTIGMIFSPLAKTVYSVELVKDASEDAQKNAQKNEITNMIFENAKVEDFLKKISSQNISAEVLVIDPPRAGMHPDSYTNILAFNAQQIVYISCNPATLGRDLEHFLKDRKYKISSVQAVDMFPHTHHIEVIVKLEKNI